MPAALPSCNEPAMGSTILMFLLGGAVTAVFSGSLDFPAANVGFLEVIALGMLVPSFTWIVQLSSSLLTMPSIPRNRYWAALGRACAIGSFALLPAAIANLTIAGISPMYSAINVIASVVAMAWDLFRQCRIAGIAMGWPVSWCLTISLNMSIFVWSSRAWWRV
jgi:hypothetical protein